MKGRSAAEELAADRRALERLGLVAAVVTEHGGDLLDEPVLTVDLRFAPKHRRERAGSAETARGSATGRDGGAVWVVAPPPDEPAQRGQQVVGKPSNALERDLSVWLGVGHRVDAHAAVTRSQVRGWPPAVDSASAVCWVVRAAAVPDAAVSGPQRTFHVKQSLNRACSDVLASGSTRRGQATGGRPRSQREPPVRKPWRGAHGLLRGSPRSRGVAAGRTPATGPVPARAGAVPQLTL